MASRSPVKEDAFSYTGNALLAEASGNNRHRRATVQDLKAYFKSSGGSAHPAHWYEAQLIHYGLKPSKSKAVARMRLFDAVNSGRLSVPTHIQKLETKLKKDWIREKQVREMGNDASGISPNSIVKNFTSPAHLEVEFDVGHVSFKLSTQVAAAPATPKKAKITEFFSPYSRPSTKSNHKATGNKARQTPVVKQESDGKSMALGYMSTPTRPSLEASSIAKPPSSDLLAHSALTGRLADFDFLPPPVPELAPRGYINDAPERQNLSPLGLLNGRYALEAQHFPGTDSWVVFTLHGTRLWGSFRLGSLSGVLHFEERPWVSSYERHVFGWRGRDDDGSEFYGDMYKGSMVFLGDGKIIGSIDWLDEANFRGERLPGQGTRSHINPGTMEAKWEEYMW